MGIADQFKDKAKDLADQGKQKMGDGDNDSQDRSQDMQDRARDTADKGKQKAEDAAKDMKDKFNR
ncbi:hypothetical protein [Streptomyces sp. NPDC057682]|uniref:hypothetical protein n=1 Tax=unclassified Streptomyces TaxID=2593676 RepID=UPI00364E5886